MKNFIHVFYVIATTLTLLCFAQCKKDHKPLNITLYDKPLPVIQANIRGNWKLQYGKGGICGTCLHTYNNVYNEFINNNRIKITANNIVYTDTSITWIKEPGTYTNGTSTFTMNFTDKRGYPYVRVVDKIVNDTLILHDNSSDAIFLYFTKNN